MPKRRSLIGERRNELFKTLILLININSEQIVDCTKTIVTYILKMLGREHYEKNKDRKTCDITELSTLVQLRPTRRIDGEYTLTTNDVYKHFDDTLIRRDLAPDEKAQI